MKHDHTAYAGLVHEANEHARWMPLAYTAPRRSRRVPDPEYVRLAIFFALLLISLAAWGSVLRDSERAEIRAEFRRRRTEPSYYRAPARYAKGMHAVSCPSLDDFKTRAARLIGDHLHARYSNREHAYIASSAQVVKLETLYREGRDCSPVTGKLDGKRDCPNCGGDGFSAEGGDCPACNGTGKVQA